MEATEVLEYEICVNRQYSDTWNAEATGQDGECYTVLFIGPDAESRATEYANFKNGDL